MLAGDIESNPGPDNAALLAEMKKLSAGQAKMIAEMQDLKNQSMATTALLDTLSKRLTDLEGNYQSVLSLQADMQSIRADSERTAQLIHKLEARVDDAENRSRRNNLVFYGLPDPSASEPSSDSEKIILNHCSDYLNVRLEPKEIERAHRIGRHSCNRKRPIIVKFVSYKTKEAVLSKGRNFKGTDKCCRSFFTSGYERP